MKCPLCESRKARRSCPAKSAQICNVCCATKREIEIDCPTTCGYLREGHAYEQQRTSLQERAAETKVGRVFDRAFLVNNEPFLMQLWQIIWESHQAVPQIHDADVLAAMASLQKTFQTLDSGLYYDSTPNESLPKYVFSKLKESIEKRLQDPDLQKSHLKVSTVIDCLAFVEQYIRLKNSGRPLCRTFLMELDDIFLAGSSADLQSEPLITLS